MHKMSTKTHKNSIEKVQYNPAVDIENEPTKYESSDQKGIPPLPDMEIEKENRLSKIMSLHSKGLNQEEIARKLEVNQSTISRDLKFIKEQAKSQIDFPDPCCPHFSRLH